MATSYSPSHRLSEPCRFWWRSDTAIQPLDSFDLRFLLLTTIVSSLLGCSGGRTGERVKAEGRSVTHFGLQAEIDIIHAEIHQRQAALLAGDYETHLDSAHPVLFALGGGREVVHQNLEAGRHELAGMELDETTFPSDPIFIRGTRNEFAIAPVTLVFRVKGQLIEDTTFHLGIRTKLFPDFPPQYELPERVMKSRETSPPRGLNFETKTAVPGAAEEDGLDKHQGLICAVE